MIGSPHIIEDELDAGASGPDDLGEQLDACMAAPGKREGLGNQLRSVVVAARDTHISPTFSNGTAFPKKELAHAYEFFAK